MRGRTLVVVAVAFVATVTAGVLVVNTRSVSVGLAPSDTELGTGPSGARIGRAVNVGVGAGIEAVGEEPVHVESVEVVGLPEGLRLKAIYAEPIIPGRGTIGGLEGDLPTTGPDARDLRPVTDAVFTPGQQSSWYFIIVVVPEKVGVFKTEGFRVKWRAGKHTGSQTYREWLRVTVPQEA